MDDAGTGRLSGVESSSEAAARAVEVRVDE
jgi:hypothetical protein